MKTILLACLLLVGCDHVVTKATINLAEKSCEGHQGYDYITVPGLASSPTTPWVRCVDGTNGTIK